MRVIKSQHRYSGFAFSFAAAKFTRAAVTCTAGSHKVWRKQKNLPLAVSPGLSVSARFRMLSFIRGAEPCAQGPSHW